MSIYHDLMLGSLCDSIEIMIVEPLSVMMFATRNHIADITALHRIIAILIHKVVCRLHVSLIVTHGSGSLMVHHKPHPL